MKVLSHVASDKYFKLKGAVVRVIDGGAAGGASAHVRMADSGDVLRVDELELETVVPAVGGTVLLLAGRHRGQRATVEALHLEEYAADLRIDGGALLRVAYEGFSREAPPLR